MERVTGHAELQELLGAYALDAVEPGEAAVLDLHLGSCPRCREEFAQHREVAALLGYAGGQAPKGVWDRIISSLEEPPPALDLMPTRPWNPIARALQFPTWGSSQSGTGEAGERGPLRRLVPSNTPDPRDMARRWGRPGVLWPVPEVEGDPAEPAGPEPAEADPADPAEFAGWGAVEMDGPNFGFPAGPGVLVGGVGAATPVGPASGATASPSPATSTIGRDATRQMVEAMRSHRSVPMRFVVAIAAAAAVIVAALGIEVGRLSSNKSQQPSVAALAYQAADANPSARHLTLTSPDGVHTVKVVIISDGETFIGPGNLQVLPPNETYQMWGVVDGNQVSLGVIGDNPTYAAFTTPVVASALAMTVEARGGVVTTTQAPVVEARVT